MARRTPYNGLCLPDSWYNVSGPTYPGTVVCPAKLIIRKLYSAFGLPAGGLHVQVGGGWIGYCKGVATGSNAYVQNIVGICTPNNYAAFLIDVWKMHLDGLWTSSIAIPYAHQRDTGATENVVAAIADETLVNINIARCHFTSSTYIGSPANTTCTPVQCGVVTVYDDGTFTIS